MSGGGIGGALGTGLGVLLAPETGGLSLAIPALAGAAGAGLGGYLSGDKNPLKDALIGGIGGGLTGGLSGGLDAADLFGGASGAAGVGDLGASEAADTAALGSTFGPVPEGAAAAGMGSAIPAVLPSTAPAAASAANGASGSSGLLGSVGSYLGKQNPLALALAGNTALSAAQTLLSPQPKFNIAGNAQNVMATNPNFNASLPKYTMQNTATPYAGNWYTYGESPQAPLYNATPQPVPAAKNGGLIGYAQGGRVKGYAQGGQPNPLAMTQPSANSPQAMMPQPPVGPVNPLAVAAAHKIGVAIGKHIAKSIHHTPDGRVHGHGGGQDDIIPARLSQDEYVLSADIPSALGDGSSEHGAKKLDQMVKNIRAHKKSKNGKLPPKAKNPLSYLPKKEGA